MTIRLVVNGVTIETEVSPTTPLVDVLRDELDLTGAKVGCGIGFCGACTVHMDDRPVHACSVLVGDCDGASIETIESVSRTWLGAELVRSFAQCGAVQCGFCTPGLVMTAVGLLSEQPSATRQEIRRYLVGNICRCTGFAKVVDAISSVAASETTS